MKLAIHIIGALSSMLFIVGILFKLQHWPGAGVLLTFGLGIFAIVFIPLYTIYHYRKSE